MNQLLGASITAGRVAVGVAAGIKCRQSPIMRVVKLLTARSFVNVNAGIINTKIDNAGHRQTQMNLSRYFTNEGNAQKKAGAIDSDEEDCIVPLKSTALDYLATLDWESLQKHILCFPRERSDAEMRILFERWVAHYEKKYPSAELKELRYATFKKKLAAIDKGNLKGEFTQVLKADCDIEG